MSCSVCGEQGHSMTKCPTLIAPLQPGFFTGGGGGGGGGNEEDDSIYFSLLARSKKIYSFLNSCQVWP